MQLERSDLDCNMKPIIAASALMLVMTFSYSGNLAAQSNEPTDDEVNAIAKQLYCPVCENVPLDVCGTRACAQWRATIREKLDIGWNEEQITKYFADQYGGRVLAQPPTEGFNVVFWALPPVVLLVGWFFVLRFVHDVRRKRLAARLPVAEQGHVDEYTARLERELEQWLR